MYDGSGTFQFLVTFQLSKIFKDVQINKIHLARFGYFLNHRSGRSGRLHPSTGVS